MSDGLGRHDDILSVVYESAADLCELGLIDKETLRKFDEMCLTPVHDFAPEDISGPGSASRSARRSSRAI
jgi:putative transcriptional regulator